MKRVLIGVVAFGVATYAGWQVSVGPERGAEARPMGAKATTAVAVEHAKPFAGPAGMLCAGGMEGPLSVEIVPLLTVARAGGDVLRYAIQLHNRSDAPLRTRYALELVTDVGTPVSSPATSAVLDLAATATTSDERATPPGLADGFYILRVTAAATGAGGDASQLVHLFFEIDNGRLLQLDTDEFYGRSNANAGVMR